jgi:succinoglycan biosynthesis transport protein ExoP
MQNPFSKPPDKLLEADFLPSNSPVPIPVSEYRHWSASQVEQKSLLDYARAAYRHKWIVLAVTLVGTIAGLAIAVTQPRLYRAHASLEFQEASDALIQPRENASVDSGDVAESYLQTQIRILQSETLVDRVVDRIDPVHRQDAALDIGPFASWKRRVGWNKASTPLLEGEYAALFARNLKVQSPDQTRIVEITCDFPNAQLAAEFVNRLTEEYIARMAEGRWATAVQTQKWLDDQVANLKRALEQSEEELQHYASTMGYVLTDEKGNLPSARLSELEAELSRAEADRIVKQSQYEVATSSAANSLPAVLDNGPLKEYQIKLTELRRQLAELNATLTPANPRILKLQPQIAELEDAMDRERANVVKRIQNEYKSAIEREKMLSERSSTEASHVNAQAGQFIRFDLLKHEVDINRQLYGALLERVKQYGVSVTMQSNQVRVIDAAKIPPGPYKPSIKLHGLVGLGCGLCIGFGIALIRARNNHMVQEPGEAGRHLNTLELGVIPSLNCVQRPGAGFLGSRRKLYGADGLPRPRKTLSITSGRVSESGCAPISASWNGASLFADSVRAVATSLLAAIRQNHARVLIFSSPASQDGKTTAVSHVGIAMSETGRRVILIDGDLRKPRLHNEFELSCDWGLADILRADADLAGVDPGLLALKTPFPNLFVLPAGMMTGSIGEALYSKCLPELIRRFRDAFDVVLIDSPPAASLPDARIIGRFADAMVLVVRCGRTNRDEAALTCHRLITDRIPLLGTILNDWQPKPSAYSYYEVLRPA